MKAQNELIKRTEQEYADHLLRKMTIDMTMDFYYTKECALKCVEEMLILSNDSKTYKFLIKVQNIIYKK